MENRFLNDDYQDGLWLEAAAENKRFAAEDKLWLAGLVAAVDADENRMADIEGV